MYSEDDPKETGRDETKQRKEKKRTLGYLIYCSGCLGTRSCWEVLRSV